MYLFTCEQSYSNIACDWLVKNIGNLDMMLGLTTHNNFKKEYLVKQSLSFLQLTIWLSHFQGTFQSHLLLQHYKLENSLGLIFPSD